MSDQDEQIIIPNREQEQKGAMIMSIFSSFNTVNSIIEHGDVASKIGLAKYADEPILVRLACDESERVRLAAVKRGSKKVLKQIMTFWKEESPKVLFVVASAWSYELKKLSRHSSPYVREGVVLGIERLGEQVTKDELEIIDRLSRDPSPDVRRAAVRACAYVAPYKIQYFMCDPEPEVRRCIVRYGTKDQVELLKSDPSYFVRTEAYEMLHAAHWN